MKKIILAIAAIFVLSGASAQNFEFGVKGGLNIAGITNTDDNKMKPSIYVGLFAEWRVSQYFGVQPELVYSRQGDKFKFDATDTDVKRRLNYLNILILAKIYVLEQLSLDLGPQFGILLNSKVKYKHDGDSHKDDLDNYKNFDFSIPVGLTYNFAERWDVSARYNIGITKVHDSNGDKPKNSVIQLDVGFRF